MVKISGGRLAAKNQGNQKAKASVQGDCRAADPLADGLGASPVNSFWKVSKRPYQRVKQVRAVAKSCKTPGSLQQPKMEPLSWSHNGARAPPVGGRVAIKKSCCSTGAGRYCRLAGDTGAAASVEQEHKTRRPLWSRLSRQLQHMVLPVAQELETATYNIIQLQHRML